MKVALFGATGFVGGYLIDELLERGHEPVVLVRPQSSARLRQPQHCQQVQGEIGDAQAVRATLTGCQAVIYNIGVLREFPNRGITYQSLHFEGAKLSMDLAQEVGANRYLLMSANGVKADGTGYQQTKYLAEQYLQRSDLDWTIFRPSVIFGDPRGAMEFATQLERDLIRMPIPAPLFHAGMLPLHAGTFGMSPVHVQDVAHSFGAALDMPETIGQTYMLGGPDCLEWRRIIQIIAAAIGTTKLALPAPAWAVRVVAGLLDRFEFCPITRDQIDMLMEGNCCGPEALREVFHIEPRTFDQEALGYLKSSPQGT